MKKSIIRAGIAAIAVLVTSVSVTAIAWPGGHRGGPGADPERMIDRLDRHLDLTDEQETQISELINASFDEASTDRDRLMTLREQLEAQTVNFDAGSAQQAADEIGTITGRMVFRKASTHASVYALLDAEQREQFAELKEKRDQRREKFRGFAPGRFN